MFSLVKTSISLLLGAQLALTDNSARHVDLKALAVSKCLTLLKVPQALPGTHQWNVSSAAHNLRLTFTPRAIALPKTTRHVQGAVTCGRKTGVKINARSGGHNQASHGIGGEDGHLIIDLRYFNEVVVDEKTKVATVGSGARLGNLAIALDKQGRRALPAGVCPK